LLRISLEFSNKSSIIHYHFLYKYIKEVNGIKKIEYYSQVRKLKISEGSQEQLEVTIVVHDTKIFKKVGVMTLEDSWFDERSCSFKRIGSSCKKFY
jgi:hypothetical protein